MVRHRWGCACGAGEAIVDRILPINRRSVAGSLERAACGDSRASGAGGELRRVLSAAIDDAGGDDSAGRHAKCASHLNSARSLLEEATYLTRVISKRLVACGPRKPSKRTLLPV